MQPGRYQNPFGTGRRGVQHLFRIGFILYTVPMLYFLHGTDKDSAREKARELLETLQTKKPDAAQFRLEPEKWSESFFDELIGSQGLFEQKYIVFADKLFENAEAKEAILGRLKEVGESENIFIFLEGKVDKATLTKIEKRAAKVQVFEEKGGKGAPSFDRASPKDFNIFSLTDAFGRRDKKNLWVLYQKSVESDVAPEEVHGILFWQLKSMMLADEAKTAKEAGLAPFVFSKAKGFLNNFSSIELKDFSKKLVALYSDARRGAVEFEIGLERFILNI